MEREGLASDEGTFFMIRFDPSGNFDTFIRNLARAGEYHNA
jgi:hypothetical protein